MLNDYMWDLYLRAGGKEIVEMFRRNLGKALTQEFADSIRNFHHVYMPICLTKRNLIMKLSN